MSRMHWIAAAALAATACGGDPPAPVPPVPVTVVQVGSSSDDPGATRYSGAIKADESVDVAFRVSGIVDAITQVRGADGRLRAIQDGDPVRKGQVLARLRQAEYRDQVSDADATLRQAEADYERASQLYENRSISKAEYDAAYARYTASQARRSQSAISLGDATLRAPLDGVILSRSAQVGSLAGPTAAAFSLADTRVVKVVFGVPDVVVARLKLGQTLPIQAEALPNARLEGRITRISPSADPNSRVFEVEAALPNPQGRLKVGMLATLQLGGEVRNTEILVPLAAIVRPAGDTASYAVYVVADSAGMRARLRPVRLGQVSGNLIAVREGLRAGERVIVRGATIVTDGQTVQILH
ncbi:MAG: efflux RND transporter periplasmic adaptor subunit [Acidobacteria bacterium]|nr:MAG: efflux RND transporter periplasmic adaptor subunit [Acidobacteriota bacterium]